METRFWTYAWLAFAVVATILDADPTFQATGIVMSGIMASTREILKALRK